MSLVQDPPVRVLLLSLILATTGLAGCFDGNDDPTGLDALFGSNGPSEGSDRTGAAEAIDQIGPVEAPQGDLDECEDCILLGPLDEDANGAEQATTSKHPGPAFWVARPRVGDHATITGSSIMKDGWARDWVPRQEGGHYTLWLRVDEALEADRMQGQNDVRFRFAAQGDHWNDALDIVPGDITWFVDPDTRRIEHGTGRAYVPVESGGGTRRESVDVRLTPEGGDLFWLGSHLWGRALRPGDEFLVYPETGPDRPPRHQHTHFDYKVLDVRTDTVDSLDGLRQVAEVRLFAYDGVGNVARWTFLIDAASPYPVVMDTVVVESAEDDGGWLPRLGREQYTLLEERGTRAIPWDRPVWGRIPSSTPVPAGAQAVTGSVAPDVLDRLPTYPLDDAFRDLSVSSLPYREYIADHPHRIVAAASYEDRYSPDRFTRTQSWSILFFGGSPTLHGFRITRVADPDATLGAPIQTGHFTETRNLTKVLLPPAEPRLLADGSSVAGALQEMGIEKVHQVRYDLFATGDRLEGRLAVMAALEPLVEPDAPTPIGYVVQDLGSGRLLHVGQADRDLLEYS